MKKDIALNSFMMGGYECADHINRMGIRINLQKLTQHDIRVDEDYKRLKKLGILVVREGICWSEVEKEPFVYDFSRLIAFYEAAEKYGIQIIWDLCHFGYPDDLCPTHPQFTIRFAALAEEFCMFHRAYSNEQLWVVPINEISFLAWHSGDMRGTVPFAVNSGWDIKYHLCKAMIYSIQKIKNILPNAIVLAVEPIIKVHPLDPNYDAIANEKNEHQYQALDIILGRMCPELGGRENLIDVLGLNYYFNNQWLETGQILPWPEFERKRNPFSELLMEVAQRYDFPLIITETGNYGENKSRWMIEVFKECEKAILQGVDLRGICIYPVIDRPDWDDLISYCQCGIWDISPLGERISNQEFMEVIRQLHVPYQKILLQKII